MSATAEASATPKSVTIPKPLHRTSLGTTMAFGKDPVGFIGAVHNQGPLARFDLLGQKALMVADPDLVREVLLTRAGEVVKFKALPRIELLLGKGLFTTEGEEHKRHRRMVMPAFHRQIIGAYANTLVNLANAERERWTDGQRIELPPMFSHLSLDMMVQSLYGTKLGSGLDRIQAAMKVLAKHFAISTPVWLDRLKLRLPFLPSTRETFAAVAEMDAVMVNIFESRQRSGKREEDLLQMLIDARDEEGQPLSQKELRDESMTLMLAGHDTMATALTWTVGLLVQHPEIQEAMAQELKALNGQLPSFADYPKLGLVERIFAESMRLFPPGWLAARVPKGTFSLGGNQFGPDMLLVSCPYWAHRDTQHWPDPERFDPDRFLPAAKEARKPGTYLPFSSGPRSCVGENFAWMQGVLVLATLCQKWRFEAPSDRPMELKPVARFLLSPEKAPTVVVRQR